MDDSTRRTSTGSPLSGHGAMRSPGLSAPASPSMPSMRSAAGVGKPLGPSAAMRAGSMTPPVTSAAPKAPPAPTSTAPVGAPRIPNATRVAQGRAATVLGGVAGAAVAVDGFKQLMNADNVGQRLEGAGRLMLGVGQFMPGAGPLLKGASRLGSGAALVVDDARTTIDGNRNRSLERERVVNEILARTPRPDGGGEPVGAPHVALPPPLPTGPQRPQLGSAPKPRLAPPPFTRPREFGQAGVIERAAVEAGYGVVGHAWGGDPDAIGGGGARPVYGVTLPGLGDQAGAPGPGPARASPDIGQSGYGVVGMAYGGDPDAIGGGGPRPVYGWSIGAPADSSHAPGQGEVSTPGSGSIENLRPSPGGRDRKAKPICRRPALASPGCCSPLGRSAGQRSAWVARVLAGRNLAHRESSQRLKFLKACRARRSLCASRIFRLRSAASTVQSRCGDRKKAAGRRSVNSFWRPSGIVVQGSRAMRLGCLPGVNPRHPSASRTWWR